MAPELDVYARLTENQLLNRAHPEEGMFIAESPKVIERALDAGCIPVSLLMETKHVQGEAKEMIERCGDIPVYTAEFDVLTKLTGFALTRGALCAMYRPKLQEPEEICAKARRISDSVDIPADGKWSKKSTQSGGRSRYWTSAPNGISCGSHGTFRRFGWN